MLLKEEAPIRDAKGRKTARPKRDEEVSVGWREMGGGGGREEGMPSLEPSFHAWN